MEEDRLENLEPLIRVTNKGLRRYYVEIRFRNIV